MNKRNSEWLRTFLKQTSRTSASKETFTLNHFKQANFKMQMRFWCKRYLAGRCRDLTQLPTKTPVKRQGRLSRLCPAEKSRMAAHPVPDLGGFPAVGLLDSAETHSWWLRPRDRKSEGLKKGQSHFVFFIPAKNQTALLWLHQPCF